MVVIGSGPIGCLHVRLARARGAARVFLVDLNADRLATGRRTWSAPDARDRAAEVDVVDAGR